MLEKTKLEQWKAKKEKVEAVNIQEGSSRSSKPPERTRLKQSTGREDSVEAMNRRGKQWAGKERKFSCGQLGETNFLEARMILGQQRRTAALN